MGSISDYAMDLALNSLLGHFDSRPSGWYLALFTGDPATDGSEVVDANYERQPIDFDVAFQRVAVNKGVMNFPAPAGLPGTATHFVVFDDLTNGNYTAGCPFEVSRAYDRALAVVAGEVKISISKGILGTWGANTLLDWLLGGANPAMPATVYASLHSSNPIDEGNGRELSGNNYVRMATDFDVVRSGSTKNSAAVKFPTPTGAWDKISHFGVWDASTTGNLIAYGTLDGYGAPALSDTVVIAAGAMAIAFN